MACRGDVDTEDVDMVAQVARSGSSYCADILKTSNAACLVIRKKK